MFAGKKTAPAEPVAKTAKSRDAHPVALAAAVAALGLGVALLRRSQRAAKTPPPSSTPPPAPPPPTFATTVSKQLEAIPEAPPSPFKAPPTSPETAAPAAAAADEAAAVAAAEAAFLQKVEEAPRAPPPPPALTELKAESETGTSPSTSGVDSPVERSSSSIKRLGSKLKKTFSGKVKE
jgi:hypothetical protein